MAKIEILKRSIIITGKSYSECKMEFDKLRNNKDFNCEFDLNKMVLRMAASGNEEFIATYCEMR